MESPVCLFCSTDERVTKVKVQISYARYQCFHVCRDCRPALQEAVAEMRGTK